MFSFVSRYDFIWRKFPFILYATGIYVARNFCGCPACASSVDVSVRKCHEALQKRGLLESHDSQRLLLYGEKLLLRLHKMMMIYGVLVKEVKVVLI